MSEESRARPPGRGLSLTIAFEDIPPEGMRVRLRADVDDLNALVERLSVHSVAEVEAEFELFRSSNDSHVIDVEGWVRAQLSQSCVVTLEPLPVRIDSAVSVRFTDVDDELDEEWGADAEGEDPPEFVEDGIIDLGDLVAQQLALDIEPFPRAEGVPFIEISTGDSVEIGRDKPFAGLAAIRDKLKD